MRQINKIATSKTLQTPSDFYERLTAEKLNLDSISAMSEKVNVSTEANGAWFLYAGVGAGRRNEPVATNVTMVTQTNENYYGYRGYEVSFAYSEYDCNDLRVITMVSIVLRGANTIYCASRDYQISLVYVFVGIRCRSFFREYFNVFWSTERKHF